MIGSVPLGLEDIDWTTVGSIPTVKATYFFVDGDEVTERYPEYLRSSRGGIGDFKIVDSATQVMPVENMEYYYKNSSYHPSDPTGFEPSRGDVEHLLGSFDLIVDVGKKLWLEGQEAERHVVIDLDRPRSRAMSKTFSRNYEKIYEGMTGADESHGYVKLDASAKQFRENKREFFNLDYILELEGLFGGGSYYLAHYKIDNNSLKETFGQVMERLKSTFFYIKPYQTDGEKNGPITLLWNLDMREYAKNEVYLRRNRYLHRFPDHEFTDEAKAEVEELLDEAGCKISGYGEIIEMTIDGVKVRLGTYVHGYHMSPEMFEYLLLYLLEYVVGCTKRMSVECALSSRRMYVYEYLESESKLYGYLSGIWREAQTSEESADSNRSGVDFPCVNMPRETFNLSKLYEVHRKFLKRLERNSFQGWFRKRIREAIGLPREMPDVKKEVSGECNICLAEFSNDEIVGTLPCGHYFYKKCIKRWLRMGKNCPICRFNEINIKEAAGVVKAPPQSSTDAAPSEQMSTS